MKKVNVLVNLPEGFYKTKAIQPIFKRLNRFANVRKRAGNNLDELKKDLAWADVMLKWWMPWAPMADLLALAPNLRFMAEFDVNRPGAEEMLKRGLPVSAMKSGFSPAVAEMALTLILSTLRRVSDHQAAMRQSKEKWVASFPDDIDPQERELTGKTVGIIGLGRIGRRLAELLAPFRGSILTYDPFVPDQAAKKVGAEKMELLLLLKQSDVVVICAASNKGTQKLIGKKEIAALKPNAVLVNVARATLVDTEALIARLKKGNLFAALDVFDKEPLDSKHPLRKLPNAYLTPHRAGGLMVSVERILNGLIDDIEAFLNGKPLQHPLTESMLPGLDG